MKKNVIPALLAAVSCLLLVSCNRNGLDPEEGGGESQPSAEARFWDVVGNLVSMKDMTPDYRGKTFKPIIGSPDNGDESVRVVAANSLEYAVDLFNAMTGSSIDVNTTTYTYQDSEVGRMVWNKDASSGTAWATVDVNIPCVPSLHKIIYRSPEQGDVNGSVGNNGSAYYRFGDIISRTRPEDGVLEYWICTRPAFDPEGKGDSHWVSVSPLPIENLWPYNSTTEKQHGKPWEASNKMHYGFPTGLKDGSVQIQNLSELLYAIYYPSDYIRNITNYSTETRFGYPSGLPIFKDFHVSNIKYHNEAFWNNVQKAWRDKGIARRVFGLSDQELAAAVISERGLHFLHKSSSWSTTTSNKPKLYQVQVQLTTEDDTKRNMHKKTLTTESSQVVVPRTYTESNTNYPFDVHTETSVDKPYVQKQNFFGDNDPRWMVRFVDGDELAENGKWDPQQPLSGFEKHRGGEVYRYYSDVFPDHNLTDPPEISDLRRGIVNDASQWTKTEYTGDHHYELGDVLRDSDGRLWFVIGIAGTSDQRSPYAELVCFEGIQTASAGAVASNIATKDQALRAGVFLWYLFRQINKNPEGPVKTIAANIKDNAHVDIAKLAQTFSVQNNSGQSNTVDLFSVAYNGGTSRQNLLRYVNLAGNYESYTYLWTRYPSSKVTQVEKYSQMASGDFSSVDICLQDVAESSKVNSYAEDALAKKPVRTGTESRANDVSNYFYNSTTWASGTQPTGMWNEPVLFFRTAVLYDRGGDYSTRTKDGRDLTMVSSVTTVSQPTATWTHEIWSGQTGTYRRVNGEVAGVPSWQSAWGQ